MIETIALLALAQDPAPEPAWKLRLRAESWWADPRGWGRPNEAAGRDLSDAYGDEAPPILTLGGGAGIDGAAPVLRLELGFELPREGGDSWGLRIVWASGDWSGTGSLGQTIDAGGAILPAGTATTSSLDLDLLVIEGVGWSKAYDRAPAYGSFSFGFGLLRSKLVMDTEFGRIEDENGAGLLTLSLGGGLRPASGLDFEIGARYVGFCVSTHYAEICAQAGVVLGPLRLEGGWRWGYAKNVGDDPDDASLQLDGPFLAVSVSF